jgi:hypothetical protein
VLHARDRRARSLGLSTRPALLSLVIVARSRIRSGDQANGRVHPIGTPATGLSANTGPLATSSWLVARALLPGDPRWFVELVFEIAGEATTVFQLEIYAEEWGYQFHHDGKASWIRVTDIPFVHGQDEHALLRETPKLHDIGRLFRTLDTRFGLGLSGCIPTVRTNIRGAEPIVLEWVRSLEIPPGTCADSNR